MYTLRIINQELHGAQISKNVLLGECYDILSKTPIRDRELKEPVPINEFNKAINVYFKCPGNSEDKAIDETIMAFVYSANASYPIRSHEVAYIVNDKGQTIERVYGLYEKY